MSNKIQFKRGLKQNLPYQEDVGTPLWCTDTNELYMGTGDGVTKVGNQKIQELEYSSRIFLATNTINIITSQGSIRFYPPSIENYEDFNQILVQLYMPSVVTINLGVSIFFNGKTPDLSKAGNYDIIYEFDRSNWDWTCGVIYKGYPEE
ncbi:MAG: hypothetical protein IJ681_00050 [Bacteroidales bacterium]|nr:hypothetical protein [Bacteroidales bacterium]